MTSVDEHIEAIYAALGVNPGNNAPELIRALRDELTELKAAHNRIAIAQCKAEAGHLLRIAELEKKAERCDECGLTGGHHYARCSKGP